MLRCAPLCRVLQGCPPRRPARAAARAFARPVLRWAWPRRAGHAFSERPRAPAPHPYTPPHPDPPCSALVPTLHATDLGTAKGLKKFKEGQKVAGKVLTVDAGEAPPWAPRVAGQVQKTAQRMMLSASVPGCLAGAPLGCRAGPEARPEHVLSESAPGCLAKASTYGENHVKKKQKQKRRRPSGRVRALPLQPPRSWPSPSSPQWWAPSCRPSGASRMRYQGHAATAW